MGARFGYTNIDKEYDRGITDMQVVNRERTTADPYAPGAAGDPKKFDTLIYPLDLNPENFFPEAICFQVKKRVGLSLEEVKDIAAGGMGEMIKGLNPVKDADTNKQFNKEANKVNKEQVANETNAQNAEAAIQTKATQTTGEVLDQARVDAIVTPFNKMYGAASGHISAARSVTPQGTTANTLGNIYMNMPQSIQFQEPANWDSTSLGWVGAVGNGIAETGTRAIAGSAGNVGAAMLGGSIGALFQTLGIKQAGLMGAGLAALSSGSQIQAGIETKMGMAQNPYMEMMFQGIGFRKFTFNFIMRPRSQNEVQQVMGILKMFRMHSKPDWAGGMMGQGFMKYPMEFHISFLTLEDGSARISKPNKMATNVDKVYNLNSNIPLIKPCVCTNVETNYTPQSIWAAYKGGHPISVTLGLSFNETELVMADDVEKGY